jgi:hypothetical protein
MSRDDEMQADLLGTGILYDSGYDPRGLAQFFETISAKNGSGGVQLLSDHPNPGNRTQYVNAEIATLPRRPNPMVTSATFTRIHSMAVGQRVFTAEQIKGGAWKGGNYAIAPGPGRTESADGTHGNEQNGDSAPRYGIRGEPNQDGQSGSLNGQTRAVVLGGSALGLGDEMTTYHGAGYTIDFPGKWTATAGQNGSVTIAPAGGAGAFGIAYGALIDTAKVNGNGITDADTLSNATRQLVQRFTQQNGGLQQIGEIQAMSIGQQGSNAVELRGQSPIVDGGNALQERDWLVTVARPDGDLSYMIFVSPEQDFERLRSTFVTIMKSFRPVAATSSR